jgi:cyclase
VVAWLPEERILFAGDLLFHDLTPLVFMGSVDGALRADGSSRREHLLAELG